MLWREPDVTVVGGGLAGCEAAWQLAERGARVALVEMKPCAMSPAHQTPLLCELVCSNSLRSDDAVTPAGLLKWELRRAGSMVIGAAEAHRVPAGAALAVERFGFGAAVTRALAVHPNVRLERRVLDELPDGPTIMATGPLTGGKLAELVMKELGGDRMYFYDAIAPIVAADSVDEERAFRASRWDKDGSAESDGDYLNCPLTKPEYEAFVTAVIGGRKVTPHEFEEPRYFEGCLPIEVMAERGLETLRHGPMRPVGLTDPRTGRWPYAVVQLRPENTWGTAYNLVGFQTRLAYPEQQRILAMIPALANAEWLRFGSIHRNTYLDAPRLFGPTFELKTRPSLRFAGLLTGVEGYIESCAMGLLVAWMTLEGDAFVPPPATTMLGALYRHVTRAREPKERYAPTNVNYGLLPPLDGPGKIKKDDKKALMSARAQSDLDAWLAHRTREEKSA
ncbi:MAG TPA: methylenetetrahydrofolate--tRNA-(uracil(54)-C(5))-methyltransferase (FADH(2)-oxidizing) TrmFO [Kofleriaceae bacterium]|nr:methylenetetrahydrofolate--tRNA-(uracil(54)-C(5))-methyltransferase (FADH(2)-oxidizing) TrmFO [Kofleriaceae bacterium]